MMFNQHLIPFPPAEKASPEERRMEAIGQNGNDGLHYSQPGDWIVCVDDPSILYIYIGRTKGAGTTRNEYRDVYYRPDIGHEKIYHRSPEDFSRRMRLATQEEIGE